MKCNAIVSSFCLIVFLLFSSLSLNSQTKDESKLTESRNGTRYVNKLLQQVDNLSQLEFDSATVLLTKALVLSEKLNFNVGKIQSLEKLGNHFYSQGFRFRAIDYYLRALAVAEMHNNVDYQIILTKNIGDHYLEEDSTKSIFYFNKNLELNRSKKDQEKYLLAVNDIGIANLVHNNLNTALIYFQRCKQENNTLKSIKINSASNTNIGVVYALQKKYEAALNQFIYSLEYAKVDGYGDTVPFIKNEMAIIYINLGQENKAIQLASEAITELPEKYVELKTAIYKTLSTAHENSGNEKDALANYKIFTERKLTEDSLKTKQIFKLLNLTFENEEQLQSINKLDLEIQEKEFRNTLTTVAVVFLLIIVLLSLYFYKLQRDKANLIEKQNIDIHELNNNLEEKVAERTRNLQQANAQLKIKNAEIVQALVDGQTLERRRVGVELHDNLGSTLSAIKWQLQAIGGKNLDDREKKIYDGVINMLEDAYSEVRLISHNMLPEAFEKFGLIGALRKLIDDINSTGKISFEINTQKLSASLEKKVEIELYGICLELINNILKHANAENAVISFSNDNERLQLVVFDDGLGLPESFTTEGQGLKNIKGRIKVINGEMNIERGESGAKFTITVPVFKSTMPRKKYDFIRD